MAELSPAAQAVRDAALATYDKSIPKDDNLWALDRASVVAALRAAALHIYSDEYETCGGASYALMIDVDDLLAIAAELEAQ
jgi:hypothetical protein